MSDYRLYHIANAHFCRVEVIAAFDDAGAIDAAAMRLKSGAAELWCGARRVRSFEATQRESRSAQHGLSIA